MLHPTRLPVVIALLLPSLALAADWPRFRGPTGDGVSTSRSAPLKWSPTENVTWKTKLPGPGSSSPIVAGKYVFLTCYSGYGIKPDEGDPAALKRHAIALDRATGKILWQHVEPAPQPETVYTGRYIVMHGYASASPVTDGKNVYFHLAKSGVLAFTLDGKKLWRQSVGDKSHDWGSGASPILHGNLLIVNASAESDQLIAFDKASGKQVWASKGFARAWNTPAIVKIGGSDALLVANQTSIRALDPMTGKDLWTVPGIRAAELCPSIVSDGKAAYLVGSPKGETMAIKFGATAADKPTELWRSNKGSNVVSPVLHQGHLYFANDTRGTLYCLKAETGEVVYEERLPGRVGQIYASPVLVGDKLYYVSRTGGTFIVPALPKFQLIQHNPPLDASSSSATPAIVDGQIFLRSDEAAYCIGRAVK